MNLIIDAESLLKYSFYKKKDLRDIEIGATWGFFNKIYEIKTSIYLPKIDNVYIAWEGVNGKSRRRKIYPEYKGNRKPTGFEKTLLKQRRECFNISKNLNYYNLYIDDLEGDDIIGILCKKLKKAIILTGDSDLHQLITDNISVYQITKNKKGILTLKGFKKRNDYTPDKIPLIKAICGDTSDNISGLKGIREKTLNKKILLSEITLNKVKNIFDKDFDLIDKFHILVNLLDNKITNEKDVINIDNQISNTNRIENNNIFNDIFIDTMNKYYSEGKILFNNINNFINKLKH